MNNSNHPDTGKVFDKLLFEHKERLKELHGINRTAEILKQGKPLDESLQEICNVLPEAWQYPEYTVARITYDNNIFVSKNFKETIWTQKEYFEIPGNKKGQIEIFYLKEFPEMDEGPFMKEEHNLISNLANLITGSLTKEALQRLLYDNTERLKELRGINQISSIVKSDKPIEQSLQDICELLPDAWQYPEFTAARITYEDRVCTSSNFKETKWKQAQSFETPNKKQGKIEIFYLKEFPEIDEGPFMKEERNLINNLAEIIAGSAAKNFLNRIIYDNTERLKELSGINKTSQIISKGKSIETTLQEIVNILPDAWQYPDYTIARIQYEGHKYVSKTPFIETPWLQFESFITIDNKKGLIEIYYEKEYPESFDGPFMKEERNLILNLARLIAGYINDFKGRELIQRKLFLNEQAHIEREYREKLIKNKKPLQQFFNQQTLDKYIYLDMMKNRVREILFVATLYDAYILENEDAFFEQFMGAIYQYSLFSLPRITGVSSTEEAIEMLQTTKFDLIILMVGADYQQSVDLGIQIKNKVVNIPIYFLLNKKANLDYFKNLQQTLLIYDKPFVWSGDSKIFFSMVKITEDKANVENDTKVGLVRVILLVEDSPFYYSRYLNMLYSIVFGQVEQLLGEIDKNELDKLSKIRSRPKILLASNYEEAIYLFHKYKDHLLCVISDIEFEKSGKISKTAGITFIKYVKSQIHFLPTLLQSVDNKYEKVATKLNSSFINKNSETIFNQLKGFINYYIGFGEFVFRNKKNKKIASAKNLREFETLISTVPIDSLLYHAEKNQFSQWLMARGEINLAKTLNPLKTTDLSNPEDIRPFLMNAVTKYIYDKKKGRVLSFEESVDFSEKHIITLASGSLGGKGRGLAFINTLINNLDFSEYTKEVNILTPVTAIIGTDEYELFINKNKLQSLLFNEKDFTKIKEICLKAKISTELVKKLKLFIQQIRNPIAVRSSSLFEDSTTQPLAGVFDTYIIPNNQSSEKVRLSILINAIKMVYASLFAPQARTYFSSINLKIEEEKMAVILQELVGSRFESYYYPHISGIAQSYNYYPVSYMKPEEGFAVCAVGLGTYVVEGGKSYRFSPVYPTIEINSTKDLIKSSQLDFFAVDMNKQTFDFVRENEKAALTLLEISEAEKHGTLKHSASVYNPDNDTLTPGLDTYGPRVINFPDLLKYNYFPLAKTIEIILNTSKEAMGAPVEIEFAVNMDKEKNGLPSFYLLQIKPLISQQINYELTIDKLDKSKIILYTESSLGNGIINNIHDVIFIDHDAFNRLKTDDMANEIEYLNNKLLSAEKKYILIGPGRWGTRDKSVGIPVQWSQISNAQVIVEMNFSDYPLDASLGSHFFHNITSMNVGYFCVPESSVIDFIRWDHLNQQKLIEKTKYFKHVYFQNPLTVLMDGKKRTSVILSENNF